MERSARSTRLDGIAGIIALASLGACAVLGSPSRVRAGELYATGEARYDAYFAELHADQVAAAKWADEEKEVRRPLVTALRLGPDATDTSIAQSTQNQLSSGALRLEVAGGDAKVVAASEAKAQPPPQTVLDAVEQAAKADLERVKRLETLTAKLDTLAKAGRDLDVHVADAFAPQGGQKPFEVKEEIHASFDVISSLADRARHEAKTEQQFVSDLQRAVATGSETVEPKRDKPDKPDKPALAYRPKRDDPGSPKPEPVATRAPRPASVSRAAPPAAPKRPKPADSGEVFQP